MNKLPEKISVIIPVRNEEEWVLRAVGHIRKTSLLSPSEVIVVDGGSSDRTPELAGQSADRVIESPKSSRSFQMHLGAQHASGELLLFLHVDTLLPENWQELLQKAFSQNPIPPAAASFRLRFDHGGISYKAIGVLAYLRTKLTGVPQGDQGLAVTREAYFSSGGFPDAPLMEEYLFIPQLKKIGEIKIFNEPVVTSCRKYEQKGPLKNSLKNSLLVLLFYLGVSPERLARWY